MSPRLIILLLGLLAVARTVLAQEMQVPVAVQIPLFLKVLKHDRSFAARAGDELVLGVVYQDRFRASFNALKEFRKTWDANRAEKLFGIPCRWVEVPLGAPSEIGELLKSAKVDIVYVTPLRAVDVEEIAASIYGRGIVSFAAVPEYVERGLVVGVTVRRNRPLLMINLSVAREERFDFSSELLSLVRVVGRK